MKNILFVSCYSVDINNSASIELIYYINLLANSDKYKVHLLTMDFPNNCIYYDDETRKLVSDKVIIHRVKGGMLLNKLLPKKTQEVKGVTKKNNKDLLIKLKNVFSIIDPYVSWTNKAFKYFQKKLINENFHVILGMHEPPSSLICAKKIKKAYKTKNSKVKLVSYFSDPYCNELSRRKKNFIVRKINHNIEKEIISNSDKFLFVAKDNFEYYKNKYDINSNNVQLIHRGYDKVFYEKSKEIYPSIFKKNKINILHAGDIALGMRDISQFINAVECIRKDNNSLFSKLNINFYGNVNDPVQNELLSNKEYILYNSRISYLKVINYIVNSDILIILGNKEFKQIPAKIYDYLGTNAYILVIIESYKDPLYELVKNIPDVYCVLNNVKKIKEVLINLLKDYKEDRVLNREEFSNENIFFKLEKSFNE